jgi:ribose 5-phosphate isomerase A
MKSEIGLWKHRAAEAAAELVRDGMVVGLGSGSTMAETVKCLAKKKPEAVFVPASHTIEKVARRSGLKLGGLGARRPLDLVLDGADEVDPNFNLIKGRGGAHTREKILARAARRVAIVVDRTKLVERLGERSPVPVEVLPFAAERCKTELAGLGGDPKLRLRKGGKPFVTDNENYILDVKFSRIPNPAKLEREINEVPGVVENGIFTRLADVVLVGHENGCARLVSRRDFLKIRNFFHRGGI